MSLFPFLKVVYKPLWMNAIRRLFTELARYDLLSLKQLTMMKVHEVKAYSNMD